MEKELKKPKRTPLEEKERDDRINKKLAMMKHRDLQVACIKRGMPFKDVIESSNPQLANFFYKNFEVDLLDDHILDEYDTFIEGELQKRGHKHGDTILSPSFRLGFTPDLSQLQISNEGKKFSGVTTARVPKVVEPKENKPKREMDEELGVMKGTKKALTYELTKKGLSFEKVLLKVKKAFPDAKDKSVKIWYKRAKG